MKPKIFIDGEHGTTGLQIRSRLAARDDLEVISIPEAERRNRDLRADHLRAADIAILCLPDDAAKESVALLDGHNATRVIDTSTAHRVQADWAYGFAELAPGQRARIAEARLVANPGCYPTGAIALIRPLRDAGLLPADYPVTINGVTGYSGGGRPMIEDYVAKGEDAPEFFPYGLTLHHKHVPEIKAYGRLSHDPIMQPAVGNFAQGMLTVVPLQLGGLGRVPRGAEIHAAIADHFAAIDGGVVEVAPFEKVERLPEIDPERFNGTNRMKLYVFANDDKAQALLVAIYDNLGKGASGAAVQNLGLMLGLPS